MHTRFTASPAMRDKVFCALSLTTYKGWLQDVEARGFGETGEVIMTTGNVRLLRILAGSMALALAAFLISACGLNGSQRTAIVEFAKSSEAFGATAKAQLTDLRKDELETSTRLLALTPGMALLPPIQEVPGRQGRRQPELDGSFTTQRMRQIIGAVTVVQNYGEMLQKLMLDTQEAELKAASGKLVASLSSLRTELGNTQITDAHLNAIGKAVEQVGRLIVEHQKYEAIKEIVPAVHPAIEDIGKSLTALFQVNGGLYAGALGSNDRTRGAAQKILKSSTYSITDRRYAAEVNRLAYERDQAIKLAFPKVAEAAAKMVKAHEKVKESLEKDPVSFEDIKAYRKTIEELVSIIEVFAPRLKGGVL